MILPVVAGQMFVPARADHAGLKQALLNQPSMVQKMLSPVAQRATQPFSNGHPEAHFRPFDDLPGHVAHQDFAKGPFANTIAQLDIKWQAPGKFDNAVVQHRNAHFKGICHSGAINLAKDTIWQIADRIERHHALEVADVRKVRCCSDHRGMFLDPRH